MTEHVVAGHHPAASVRGEGQPRAQVDLHKRLLADLRRRVGVNDVVTRRWRRQCSRLRRRIQREWEEEEGVDEEEEEEKVVEEVVEEEKKVRMGS